MQGRGIPARAVTLCLSFAAVSFSQVIHTESATPLQETDAAVLIPIRCDSAGDIFYRAVRPGGEVLPLKEISADGKEVKTFDIPQEVKQDELKNAVVKAFAVTPSGSVYQIVQSSNADGDIEKVAIVRFDEHGQYSDTTMLEKKFLPAQFAVFSTGDFLVSGSMVAKNGKRQQFTSFTAVFDRFGRFLSEVDADKATSPASGGKAPTVESSSAVPLESYLEESGDDFVYLLSQTAKPTLLLVSSAGTIQRRLSLEPPSPDVKIGAFRTGPGEVLVEYIRPRRDTQIRASVYLYVYSTLDGQKLAAYTLAPQVWGFFGCTDWRGNFSFISMGKDGRDVLLNASSR